MPRFCDAALAYDPVSRRCDAVFDGTDLVLDGTPVTPLLLALGTDRRARPDDELPDAVSDFYSPHRIDPRGGWPGDALDAAGRFSGSRLWLLVRKKHLETTRTLAESALAEAVEPIAAAWGERAALSVRWIAPGILGMKAEMAKATLSLNSTVAR